MLDPFLLLELELTLLGRQVFYLLVQCLSFLIKHGFDFAQLGHDDLVDLTCLRLLLLAGRAIFGLRRTRDVIAQEVRYLLLFEE